MIILGDVQNVNEPFRHRDPPEKHSPPAIREDGAVYEADRTDADSASDSAPDREEARSGGETDTPPTSPDSSDDETVRRSVRYGYDLFSARARNSELTREELERILQNIREALFYFQGKCK